MLSPDNESDHDSCKNKGMFNSKDCNTRHHDVGDICVYCGDVVDIKWVIKIKLMVTVVIP